VELVVENFGVVVEMKLKVHKLQNPKKDVVAGRFLWAPKEDKFDDSMGTMNAFYKTDWPNQATIDTSWLCDLNAPPPINTLPGKHEFSVRFLVYYDGTKEDFDKLIADKIEQPDLAKQLSRRCMQEPSTRFFHETLVSQCSEEIKKAFPVEKTYSLYTSYVFKKDKANFEEITRIIRGEMQAFRREFPQERGLLQVTWIHTGGIASEKKRSDSAFRWRPALYHAYIMIQWEEKYLEKNMRGFMKIFKSKLKLHSIAKGIASYINFPDPDRVLEEEDKVDHERAYFGKNRLELQQIKAFGTVRTFSAGHKVLVYHQL
jgi:hypothetical protein